VNAMQYFVRPPAHEPGLHPQRHYRVAVILD
jgi:hypothetical protein